MRSPRAALIVVATCCGLIHPASLWAADQQANLPSGEQRRRGLELFEKKIRPVLIKHCYECHGEDPEDLSGNLRVDTRDGLLAGGDSGASVTPGQPGESLLLSAIEYKDFQMPPDQKLPDSVAADFRRWISLGAPDPRGNDGTPGAEPQRGGEEKASKDDGASEPLWSLQPLRDVSVPDVDSPWPETAIDKFIAAEQQAAGVRPNADAKPATLIRRLYFDLIGLPPTPQQVRRFVADPSPAHYARVVDSLLSSQAFGQRWARHWLDIARYGESAGSSRDVLTIYAWRYRDYVIDAFNQDLPYDRFITEQIAGDLLRAESERERRRLQIATGLLAIGSKSLNGGNLTYDVIDDQIDVVSKSVLGLTVSCARCHDHKFDPIPTADYYSLAGIFLSSDARYGGGIKRPSDAKSRSEVYLTLGQRPDPELIKQRTKLQKELGEISQQTRSERRKLNKLARAVPQSYRGKADQPIAEDLDKKTRQAIGKYQSALQAQNERKAKAKQLREKLASFDKPEYAVGVQEAKRITDAKILIRGEKNQKGDVAPRGFLSAISTLDEEEAEGLAIGERESGRRELARWLTHPQNPLPPRVAANRIWHHLMGQGLVETVDNFGTSGQPPSHPALLDYLAHQFVHKYDWSRKRLIREIVLSRTYRLSAARNPSAHATDPDNRLRWRMDRRRLEAEPLRDAMLAVSGLLRHEPLEGSLVMQIGEGEVGRNLNTSVLEEPFDYRSVYLPVIRGIIPEPLKLFDFPEPSNVQGARDANTTAKQSLFLMNSPRIIRIAERFGQDLLDQPSHPTDREKVELAYLRCFGQPPSDPQADRALRFIGQMGGVSDHAEARQDAWTAFCQSLIASARFRFID